MKQEKIELKESVKKELKERARSNKFISHEVVKNKIDSASMKTNLSLISQFKKGVEDAKSGRIKRVA
ncbi:MAG: hypothetical protein AABW51_01380 [Nanoarchaeota archaeon]